MLDVKQFKCGDLEIHPPLSYLGKAVSFVCLENVHSPSSLAPKRSFSCSDRGLWGRSTRRLVAAAHYYESARLVVIAGLRASWSPFAARGWLWPKKVISLTRSRKIGLGNVTTAPLHVGPPHDGSSLLAFGRSDLVARSCHQLSRTFQVATL